MVAAAVPQGFLSRRAWGRRAGALALACCLLGAGCETLAPFAYQDCDKPPHAPVTMVQVAWEPMVYFTPDPVNGGARLPGIVGRMYLFGNHDPFPLEGDGDVLITLSLEGCTPDGKPLQKEQWKLPQVVLKELLRKDMIGWGYTLFLPWSGYNESVTQVQMMVCYTPKGGGAPIYSQPSSVSLRHPDRLPPPKIHEVHSSRPAEKPSRR
jgi:hypothetical protein